MDYVSTDTGRDEKHQVHLGSSVPILLLLFKGWSGRMLPFRSVFSIIEASGWLPQQRAINSDLRSKWFIYRNEINGHAQWTRPKVQKSLESIKISSKLQVYS
jgi:hypothetical protein